jgi:hypothetical protein
MHEDSADNVVMNKIDLRHLAEHGKDFALWSAEQAELLRRGRLDKLDVENLAEEIESVGNSERYKIDSGMEVLLQHLLKWQLQPEKRKSGWKASIVEQRIRIARVIKRSPSLRDYPAENLEGSYVIARNAALEETGLPEAAVPPTCPYTVARILDLDFLPGGD